MTKAIGETGMDTDEKIIIAGMTLTKRGERVLMTFATLILLTIMVVVGSIE